MKLIHGLLSGDDIMVDYRLYYCSCVILSDSFTTILVMCFAALVMVWWENARWLGNPVNPVTGFVVMEADISHHGASKGYLVLMSLILLCVSCSGSMRVVIRSYLVLCIRWKLLLDDFIGSVGAGWVGFDKSH